MSGFGKKWLHLELLHNPDNSKQWIFYNKKTQSVVRSQGNADFLVDILHFTLLPNECAVHTDELYSKQ